MGGKIQADKFEATYWPTNRQMPNKQIIGLAEEMGSQPFDSTDAGREEKRLK